jgi:hypothetical protein
LGLVAVCNFHTEFGENLSSDSKVYIGARWHHGDDPSFLTD